jgi:alginate O-acetyltransferase complex protein AlgI
MLLHTPAYLIFLSIVVFLYWLIPVTRWRKYILLVASYVFCALFDIRFLAVLVVLTVVNYRLGRLIYADARPRRYLWLGIIFNLGVLVFFKYSNFFLDSITGSLHVLGVSALPSALEIILPIGLSFYTFQAISYIVQVYNRKIAPQNNFVDLALYLAFFPKLIAGPLVRPKNFFSSINNPKIDRNTVKRAFALILLGLFKKVLIADSLASIADVAYRAAASPQSISFPTLLYWQGFYLYAFQIYADFSGYTDIARGSAMLLGGVLPENFDAPYLASTPGAFWNRWHMSLTGWFREHLYFPLTRSLLRRANGRYPRLIQVCVTVVTMILIGLWHGASWTYLLWGLWHGILLSVERLISLRPQRRLYSFLGTIITFHLVAIGWIFFRTPSVESAVRFLQGLTTITQLNWWTIFVPPVFFVAMVIFILDTTKSGKVLIPKPYLPIIVTSMLVLVICLMLLSTTRSNDTHPFIYGRF